MRIEDIKKGDTLVSVDCYGTGYYRVLKVNRTRIIVRSENGNEFPSHPHSFDRKVDYAIPNLEK